MASAISNTAHSRSRTLRSNTLNLKPPTTSTSLPLPGPSSIQLFLTNLRLLDLDLQDDWPNITASTFSTKDQKRRIQCVEWALYQLFYIWDPEEARDKLQPFFPPLEPLQSLNLRAALLRCLEQTKKTGVLGREVLLRKTMLDECKGDRLEEILAVFSNAVLKKVLQENEAGNQAHAQQLAFENFSYSGERSVLTALILAHKVSLNKHLRNKNASRARYKDFSDLLDLDERRIARRHEQLKEVVDANGARNNLSTRDIRELQDQVRKNWSGADGWLDTILYGDNTINTDGVLGTSFDRVWRHVERSSIGDLEAKKQVGLLEQLDTRIRDQDARLARWQSFRKTLTNNGISPTKKENRTAMDKKNIDLGFTKHQTLQVSRTPLETCPDQTWTASLEEYTRIIENMKAELDNVGNLKPMKRSPAKQSIIPEAAKSLLESSPAPESLLEAFPIPQTETIPDPEDEWSSAGELNEALPAVIERAVRSPIREPLRSRYQPEISHTHPEEVLSELSTSPPNMNRQDAIRPKPSNSDRSERLVSLRSQSRTPSPLPPLKPVQSEESDLADQILNSVSAASPSPKKPRHTLSLAERTRLSMSRATHSKFDELDDLPDLTRLSIKPNRRSSQLFTQDVDEDKHADLISRTRKSMVGFEAAQKKAQLERRRSMKDAKKKQRESNYFPRVEEEQVTPSLDPEVLIASDPDYESVFKSRPKIKTSPAVSPTRIWEEDEE
ncbi:HAUS augmin-like complex subunit 6 N-terminus-domain-containing protein [Bisporella sp. PMI_857]|nr:HAUS augmin-like complex subunit 6 N-terminus-domain-containing protein [Bisporella sp. PMI_857]